MLTDAWFPLRPHALQSAAWRSPARFVCLYCGRGSGKTELARRRVVRYLAVKRPHRENPMYFYALPTREQARRVAWSKLKALVPADWLAKPPSETDLTIETVFGSSLHLVGMDKPQRIEGNQWDGGVVDESSDQKPGHFERSIRPALAHRSGWCWRIGVPKRFGPGAAEFKAACEQWGSGALGPAYDSFTWSSRTVLSSDEINDAMSSMDSRDFTEQFDAVWQGTSGLVFYAFDEVLNVRDCAYDPELPLVIASDFNVDPMAWVFLQRRGSDDYAIDELWMRNTNTQKALDETHRRYGGHQGGFLFFGDAAGKARSTKASLSDYAQIRNDARFERAKVFYPDSNPAIVDRFASCNYSFCSAAGERRLFVSPKCKQLIHDLTSRSYKAGTREADDSHPDRGHITDALGYYIHRVRPVGAMRAAESLKVFVRG